jgi:hypothetical protein
VLLFVFVYKAAPHYKHAAFYEDHKQQTDKFYAKLYFIFVFKNLINMHHTTPKLEISTRPHK